MSRSDALGIVALVGRILFAVFFVLSGLGFHIAKSDQAVGYARSMGFPLAGVAGWPTGIWLVVAAVSIILGVWPDVGALMLIAFSVPAALFFHTFWKMEGEMQQMQQQLFFRNVIVIGAALTLFAFFTAAGPDLRYTITGPLFNL